MEQVTRTVVLIVAAVVVACMVGAAFSRRHRRRLLLTGCSTVLGVLAVYCVGRGVVELATIDYARPDTYHDDWGGPKLAGVLAVHCGPGLVVLGLAAAALVRRRKTVRAAHHVPSRAPGDR